MRLFRVLALTLAAACLLGACGPAETVAPAPREPASPRLKPLRGSRRFRGLRQPARRAGQREAQR